jgi:predicted DNA-binding transcriptional regulator YafY
MPRSALERIYFIDRQIASGLYPNTEELAEKWEGISRTTIYRDIDFMKVWLNAPIEYNAKHRGYYYSESNYRIPMGFSGADELLALGMAKNILTLYRDTPIYDAARHLLDCITAPMASEGNSAWYEDRIVVPQVPSSPVSPETWNLITKGLSENRVLALEYQGVNDTEYKPRRVRPYQLLFDTGIWYLYGYSEERKSIRIFSLCRIKNLSITKDHFTLPKDYDYRTDNPSSFFGVFSGQKKYRFKIVFYDYSVAWVKDRQWASDQKITETGEDIIISFTSTQFEKVLEWVLSRGSTALPLEPELLVNCWQNEIGIMQRMVQES